MSEAHDRADLAVAALREALAEMPVLSPPGVPDYTGAAVYASALDSIEVFIMHQRELSRFEASIERAEEALRSGQTTPASEVFGQDSIPHQGEVLP